MEKCALPVVVKGKKNHNKGNTNTSALLKGWQCFVLLFLGTTCKQNKSNGSEKRVSTTGAGKKLLTYFMDMAQCNPKSNQRTVVKRIMQHYDISMNIQ